MTHGKRIAARLTSWTLCILLLSAGVTYAGQSLPTTAPAAVSPAAIIGAWQQVAKQENVPGPVIRQVSTLLKNQLHRHPAKISADEFKDVEKYLPAMIASDRGWLSLPAEQTHVSYWYVFCIMKAVNHPISDADREAALKQNLLLVKETAERIRQNLVTKLTKKDYLQAKPAIDREIDRFIQDVSAKVTELNQDALFPAFKTPVPRDVRAKSVKMDDNWIGYPDSPTSRPSALRSSEWYEQQMTKLVRRMKDDAPCGLSFKQIHSEVLSNPYWSDMGYSGGNTQAGKWPVEIKLFLFDEQANHGRSIE